jgi:transcriptional regulator with XRE-family HTH domain
VLSAEQIRAGRALLNWSARELAENTGLAMTTIQRLERGEVAIPSASVDTINRITRALEGAGVVLLADGVGVTMKRPEEAGAG